MSELSYYQINIDVLLKKTREYYKNNRELIRERANNRCKSLYQKMK